MDSYLTAHDNPPSYREFYKDPMKAEHRDDNSDDFQRTNQNDTIQKQFEQLLRNGKYPDRPTVENILIVGLPGAGKSSLLCTLNAALTGTYTPLMRPSRGVALTRFLKCGLRQSDIEGSKNEELLRELWPTLPNFLYFAGLEDNNYAYLREMLYLIIHGYIPSGTTHRYLDKVQQEETLDEGVLRVLYDEQLPERKVTRVLFVHNCKAEIPKQFINTLLSVLDETDPYSGRATFKDVPSLPRTGHAFVRIFKIACSLTEEAAIKSFRVSDKTLRDVFKKLSTIKPRSWRYVMNKKNYGGGTVFVGYEYIVYVNINISDNVVFHSDEGDVFVVITKQSLADKSINNRDGDENTHGISADRQVPRVDRFTGETDLTQVDRQLAAEFNMHRCLTIASTKLTDFLDDSDYYFNPEIVKQHIKHLKFLCLITSPKRHMDDKGTPSCNKVILKRWLRRARRNISNLVQYLTRLSACIFRIVCAIIVWFKNLF